MEKTEKDPSSYIDSLPAESREALSRLDTLISRVMAAHSRALWVGPFWGGTDQTIIGYGDVTTTQSRGRKVEWFMVGLALQKNHISLYVNAVQNGRYVSESFGPKLGKVKVGKASISFKRVDDVDLAVLTEVLEIARDEMPEATQ